MVSTGFRVARKKPMCTVCGVGISVCSAAPSGERLVAASTAAPTQTAGRRRSDTMAGMDIGHPRSEWKRCETLRSECRDVNDGSRPALRVMWARLAASCVKEPLMTTAPVRRPSLTSVAGTDAARAGRRLHAAAQRSRTARLQRPCQRPVAGPRRLPDPVVRPEPRQPAARRPAGLRVRRQGRRHQRQAAVGGVPALRDSAGAAGRAGDRAFPS